MDFARVEELLPKLLMLPQQAAGLSKAERDDLRASIRLCEEILSLKRQVDSLADQEPSSTSLGHASSLEEQLCLEVLREAGLLHPSLGGSQALGKLIEEERLCVLKDRVRQVPPQVTDWLMRWQEKIDSHMSSYMLRCIAALSGRLKDLDAEWNEKVCTVPAAGFGISGRMRSFFLSRRYHKLQGKIQSVKNEIEINRRSLTSAMVDASQCVSRVALLYRTPAVNCDRLTEKVRKELLIELEKEVVARMDRALALQVRRKENLTREVRKRQDFINQAKAKINELAKQVDFSDELGDWSVSKRMAALADAVNAHFRVVYGEVEDHFEAEQERLLEISAAFEKIQGEVLRLERIVNDWSDKDFRHSFDFEANGTPKFGGSQRISHPVSGADSSVDRSQIRIKGRT